MRVISPEKTADRLDISERTLWKEVSAGRFPRPIKLTARRSGFLEDDIDAWITARVQERDAAGSTAVVEPVGAT